MIHFTLDEFDSPDMPGSGSLMDTEFLRMIDAARELAGIPFIVNSGYRSPAHNQAIGGSKTSSHMKGYAADLHATTSRNRWIIIAACLQVGFTRIGVAGSFVHVDCDPEKSENVMWLY